MQVRDKVCLITGAAQGIGAATAEAMAKRGAKLVLTDRQGEAVKRFAESFSADTLALELDVTDQASIDAAIAATVDRFGGLDILINNAGVGLPRDINALDIDVWRQTIDINLTGPFRMVKAALPELKRSRGHIATVASLAAKIWVPMLGHYSASKAGVAAFSETLRIELAPDGIGITTVYFGTIDTPLLQSGLVDDHVPRKMHKNMNLAKRLGISPLLTAESAGEGIAHGIEQGRRAVVLPKRARPLYYVGAPFQRVIELTNR